MKREDVLEHLSKPGCNLRLRGAWRWYTTDFDGRKMWVSSTIINQLKEEGLVVIVRDGTGAPLLAHLSDRGREVTK